MAYSIVVDGEQFDLASIAGWRKFKQELADVGGEIGQLIDTAEADAKQLRAELRQLTDLSPSTSSVVANLIKLLSGATGRVHVSDGFTDEDVEDDWEMSEDE